MHMRTYMIVLPPYPPPPRTHTYIPHTTHARIPYESVRPTTN